MIRVLAARRGLVVMIFLFILSSCAPAPRGGMPVDSMDENLSASAREKTQAAVIPPPPEEIRSALIPAAQNILPTQAKAEERFDIAASAVPAREFFMSLVNGSSANMVVHPLVSGEISVDLKNTTIEEVLQVVHNVYGYPYFRTGQTYQVMPASLQARTFQVNYLNMIRRGSSQTRVSSGQITQNNSDSGSGTSSSTNSDVAASQIDSESTADFWSELKVALEGLIGHEDGRKVVVQPQAGMVVVVAMPDELQMVQGYLDSVQSNMQRQVVIEAKVIEVSLSDGFQSGINWAALSATSDGKGGVAGQAGGSSAFNDSMATASVSMDSLTGSLASSLDTSAFGGIFSMAMNFGDFQAFIELLESQGDVQVLSSPRIATVNNQKAVIKVGSDEFFVTDISSDTSSGTTTTTSSDITLTPFFSGIALDVTPQIDSAGRITLHIHPTVSEVTDQTKTISVFGETQSLPLAYSTVRESDSVVHATNGQLVVIGGLMQDKISNNESGVPVLSKIPALGSLFRHTQTVSSKSELVILLRPQVIGSSLDWQQGIDASRQRIENLSPQLMNNWRPF